MENGKAAVVGQMMNGLGFGSTEFHVLRPTPVVLPEYLFHFLRQPAFRRRAASAFVGTGGLQRVPPQFLSRVKLPLPTLSEQRQIVDVLRRAEDLKRQKVSIANLIVEASKALFEQHFGVAGATKHWPVETFGRHTTYSKYGPRFPDQPYSETGISVERKDWSSRQRKACRKLCSKPERAALQFAKCIFARGRATG
jgi:type I restriction enzyme S subunit